MCKLFTHFPLLYNIYTLPSFRMSEKSTDNKEDISPDGNEEKKKDYASETATNESSSGNLWIPGLAASWVNTAKEKVCHLKF